MSESPHMNEDTLVMLKEVMEDEFSVLIETYLSDSALRIESLRATIKSQDAEAIRQSAHSLKGSSGNIGALRMAELCFVLEDKSRKQALEDLDNDLRAIEQEFEYVKKALASTL